jgi:acetyl-CoA synthetase
MRAIKDEIMSIIKSYQKDYLFSCQHPEDFWAQQACQSLSWFKPWQAVLQGDFYHPEDLKWFSGGELNASFNCLDRHLKTHADQPAIIWEGNDPNQQQTITYQELYDKVCRFANALSSLNIKKGDTVCIYMPMIPEVVIAMLACARIGAIHNVVFGGFSAISLRERILNSNCSVVITADQGVRGDKLIPLKENVDNAIEDCPQVRQVIVYLHRGAKITWNSRDLNFTELMQKADPKCESIPVEATEPLFILYTSGSTGKPKGIVHATGGYLVYTAVTFAKLFNYQAGDVYWCTADVGWVTGHSYIVYGPLLNGATILLFEGVPSYPTYARCWEVIDKHQVNIFYTSPTSLRAIRKEGDDLMSESSRNSLKILGTVGEPINPDVWNWYFEVVGKGRCPIIDTWWQTETGGALIAPLPEIDHLKSGSAQWPFYGIVPQVLNHEGQPVSPNQLGELVITKPWPGMMKSIFNDPTRFQSYFDKFPGKYYSGDEGERSSNPIFF